MVKRSELIEKLTQLVGDADVDIYFESDGEVFTDHFNVFLDSDGDIRIKA